MTDRQLDAAIAERVMGHEVRAVPDDEHRMLCVYHREWAYAGDKYIWWEREGYQPEVYIPHYSASIAAAMTVVEHMRGDKWCCINIHSDHAYIWRVSFIESEPANAAHEVTASAQGESLPRAICEAALAAVEAAR